MEWIRRRAGSVQFRDASLPLARLRSIKSRAEVKCMEHAIAVTAVGQEAARRFIAEGKGRHEYEVEAKVLAAFRSHGCTTAFPSIIGGGFNGTVLHYEQNFDLLDAGDLVVVDIGARFGMYAGDLTRTYPVGGKFTPRHREIYEVVLAAHRHAVESCKVGVDTLRDMRDRCFAFLRDTSLKAADLHGVEHTLDHFMPHGLSHHLGLDVHDTGDSEAPVGPGSVITVEPGVYLPAERFGVRIEDDYLATPEGLVKLGPDLAVEPDAVEAAMAAT
jgi:Xaa-Pro aminopeptidase